MSNNNSQELVRVLEEYRGRCGLVLFLDFDGTLVPIKPCPDQVVVSASLYALMRALTREFPTCIVSGRRLEELTGFLHGLDIGVSAEHGAVHATPDRVCWRESAGPELQQIRTELQTGLGDRFEQVVEFKSTGVAMHYRRFPELRETLMALAGNALTMGGQAYELLHGKKVVEIRKRGVDKGRAIQWWLDQIPSATSSVPVFFGDDLTDEAGFAKVNALGGIGVHVGQNRVTCAAYSVPSVDAVHSVLWSLPSTSYHDTANSLH